MYPIRYERGRFPNLFDDLFRDEVINRFFGTRAARTGEPDTFAPPVDIKETDKAFVVVTDLPGVDRKDVKVNLEKGVLTLSAETRAEEAKEGESWHMTERRYGTFQRSFRLPETIDSEHVDAVFRNGVLTLTLPKAQGAAAKQISIKE